MSYRPYDGRGRGSYRGGYRGGRGTPRVFGADIALPGDRDILEGLIAVPISTLAKPTDTGGKDIKIKDLEYLASYNWVNTTHPSIIVPGSPRVWRNRSVPYAIPRDTGMRYVDQNGYRFPSSTLLPLFRAVDMLAEDGGAAVDWGAVDFITDRNGLRKLLRWLHDADGSAREFRIDTQLAGARTVLLSRWEKRTREEADPAVWSYGTSFERESTSPVNGCEDASGHHRVIKYDLDGLNMIVRFEVDACTTAPSVGRAATSSANVDSLLSMLSSLDVASPGSNDARPSGTAAPGAEVQVRRAGAVVPHSALIELTTRSKKRIEQYDWAEAFPQLWLSQTPYHYLAGHDRGTFESVVKRTLGDADLKRIEGEQQASFRRLRQVLQEIKELVLRHGKRGRISLVFRDGKLQVMERVSDASCVPEAILKRFD